MELNKRIDEFKEDIIKDTAELVKIKSVEEAPKGDMPFGEGPAKALQCALNIAKKLGFKTVNLDNYVGYAEFGEGEDNIIALGHVDVVPEGDDWMYPAYGAEIHDDKMYGRGTLDDKGPIVAALYGAKAVMDAKLPISKKIRIVFGTNEETGDADIEHYLENEKAPVAGFTPDAEYPLINGEKGMIFCNLVKTFSAKSQNTILKYVKGGQAGNVVPDKCEALIESKDSEAILNSVKCFINDNKIDATVEKTAQGIIIKSQGVGAHASTPWVGKNAIMQLFSILGKVNFDSEELNQYISFMNKNIGMECYGESFGVALEDEVSGKLTFNVGVIDMDESKSTVTVNLRYPVTFKLDNVMDPFNKTIEGTGIVVENFGSQDPLYFEPDHPLVKSLQKVYTEQTGKEATLLSIGGGTYAKAMPNILAFGPAFPGEPDTVHQVNEFITIDNLIINAKIYAHALYELAK